MQGASEQLTVLVLQWTAYRARTSPEDQALSWVEAGISSGNRFLLARAPCSQPRYVDQIELIEQEFRIEKVYYIQGSEQAEAAWAEEFSKKERQRTGDQLVFGWLVAAGLVSECDGWCGY